MKLRLPMLLVLVLSLALAACGSVEDSASPDASAATDSADADAGAPLTVTDARGEEIALEGPATEVVGLEWGPVENLVSLGVMPIGVADVEGYSNWVSAAPLDEGVTDVGMRGEPSVDALVALDPDLVV